MGSYVIVESIIVRLECIKLSFIGSCRTCNCKLEFEGSLDEKIAGFTYSYIGRTIAISI